MGYIQQMEKSKPYKMYQTFKMCQSLKHTCGQQIFATLIPLVLALLYKLLRKGQKISDENGNGLKIKHSQNQKLYSPPIKFSHILMLNSKLFQHVMHPSMAQVQYYHTRCQLVPRDQLLLPQGHCRKRRKTSQIKRESLACIFGVKRFHSYMYILGHHFIPVTDHKPLITLFNEEKPIPTQAAPRILRWALTLAAYEYTNCRALQYRWIEQQECGEYASIIMRIIGYCMH